MSQQAPFALQSRHLRADFDPDAGTLTALHNRLTGETYRVTGDTFAVEAEEFRFTSAQCQLTSLHLGRTALKASYSRDGVQVDVTYSLRPGRHFLEKRLSLRRDRPCRLRAVTISRLGLSGAGLKLVPYRYPQFGRLPGDEPLCTFFGRTRRGGLFAGLQLAFDTSALKGRTVTLSCRPSLKLRARQRLAVEPMYVGVYHRQPADLAPVPQPVRATGYDDWAPAGWEAPPEVIPLPSESAAMVAMTSAVLGPPRHGLVPMACGWHCEMEQYTYPSRQAVRADTKSLDFLAECGVDWVTDSHPWGGETDKLNALTDANAYAPGEDVRLFLEHARRVGVKVVMWPTMNNTHPWWPRGGPFRADRPDWLMAPGPRRGLPEYARTARANCFAHEPFFRWLLRANARGLDTGLYDAWAIDGSFFGDGGWYTSIVPVDCQSNSHDHLPGDANYACQRNLARLLADARRRCPGTYVMLCRPPMELGIWSVAPADACFTLLESGSGSSNLAAGDAIRLWSRVRVHHHFFPHYVDQPLLFPSRAEHGLPPNWPEGHLDYILLSALSSSPNLLFYLPTKTGIPQRDKAEIRRWLDWGRQHVAYLKVRRDLLDWPAPGHVDGSAHLLADRGLIFLFNSGPEPRDATFPLDKPIGLTKGRRFALTTLHPSSPARVEASRGDQIIWTVPPETAQVLWLEPR